MFEPNTLRHFKHEINHMLRSAADQDPEGLVELAELLRWAADDGLREACAEQRRRHGWSWARYGEAFKVTAWAAQKRLGSKKAKAA